MEVTFETAKLAKEKGFNEPSTHVYTIGFGAIKEDKTVRKFGNYEDNDKLLQPVTISKGQPHLALAPTQSDLQKWLREKRIDITVITDWKKGKRVYYVGFSYVNDNNEIDIWFSKGADKNKIEYSEYEDALEVGLFESAKTIKTEEK